jgi:Omp85 superfamily domain
VYHAEQGLGCSLDRPAWPEGAFHLPSLSSRAALAVVFSLVAAGAARGQTAETTVPPSIDGSDSKPTPWWRSAQRASQDLFDRLNDEGIFPQVKSFSENSGPAPGVVFWKPRLGDSGLSFYASLAHSFRGDDLREVRFGRIPSNGRRPPRRGDYEVLAPSEMGENGAFYYLTLRQRDLPSSELFVPSSSGVGGSSIRYRNTETLFDGVAGYRFSPHFSVAMRAGLLKNEIGPGEEPLPGAVGDRVLLASTTALTAQPDYLRTALVVAFDDRDMPRNTHEGNFVSLTLGRYADRAQGDFSFNRVTLDARRFQPLGSPRHVLALRLLTSQSFADAGSRVPFYLQDTLGGPFTMRSYPSFRFRGDKVLTLSTEYRFEVTPRYELAAFYDAGKAWDNAGFSLSGTKSSYGLGFRWKTWDSVRFRLDVGHGSEGTQVLLKLGYSF